MINRLSIIVKQCSQHRLQTFQLQARGRSLGFNIRKPIRIVAERGTSDLIFPVTRDTDAPSTEALAALLDDVFGDSWFWTTTATKG